MSGNEIKEYLNQIKNFDCKEYETCLDGCPLFTKQKIHVRNLEGYSPGGINKCMCLKEIIKATTSEE